MSTAGRGFFRSYRGCMDKPMPFRVEKFYCDVDHYAPKPEWVLVAKFESYDEAWDFICNHQAEYAGDHHRCVLRLVADAVEAHRMIRDLQNANRTYLTNLTSVQERCTELVLQKRELEQVIIDLADTMEGRVK